MGKFSSKEAYYRRLRNLAEVKEVNSNISNTKSLGTLIDYKRGADGIAYGIIKENQQYYIKKAGIKESPDVSDFVYIGGLGNIMEYQYDKLSQADKNRNMVLNTINDANSKTISKTGSISKLNKKTMLNEDAEEKIEKAEKKLDDLETATVASKTEPKAIEPEATDPEATDDEAIEPEATDPEATDDEAIEPEATDDEATDDEAIEPEATDDEATDPEVTDDEETDDEEKDIAVKDIEKYVGKLQYNVRKADLTEEQATSYVSQILSAFKPNFEKMDIIDRREIANKYIIKMTDDDDIDDLKDLDLGDEESGLDENCSECGGFDKYAESRGLNNESILECDEEEITNLVSGYANAYEDGMNDGDFKLVSLLVSPEVLEKLKSEYGHEDYTEKLTPHTDQINESSDDDRQKKINELWGGLKSLGKTAVDKTKDVGKAVVDKAKDVGTKVSQTYYKGEVNPHVDKMEKAAKDLQTALNDYNNILQKAGQEPVNINELLSDIFGGIGSQTPPLTKSGKEMTSPQKAAWKTGKDTQPTDIDLSQYKNENVVDPANIEVQPNVNENEDEDEITEPEKETPETMPDNDFGFAPDSETMGGGLPKPDGAETSSVDINVDGENKSVNLKINESEQKLRKYVRQRLKENLGLKKSKINESSKSNKIKKLDKLIDEQYKLYENVVKKKSKITESSDINNEFIPHGSYTISNAGGYEVMLSNDGEQAKLRDAFGTDNPIVSDWLDIEYIPNEYDDEDEMIPVIDPKGYNIPLNQVMKIENNSLNEAKVEHLGKNQVVIKTNNGKYFQSYDTVIAHIDNDNNVTLSEHWNYSTTTSKYRSHFLGETTNETKRKINSGEYDVVETIEIL